MGGEGEEGREEVLVKTYVRCQEGGREGGGAHSSNGK